MQPAWTSRFPNLGHWENRKHVRCYPGLFQMPDTHNHSHAPHSVNQRADEHATSGIDSFVLACACSIRIRDRVLDCWRMGRTWSARFFQNLLSIEREHSSRVSAPSVHVRTHFVSDSSAKRTSRNGCGCLRWGWIVREMYFLIGPPFHLQGTSKQRATTEEPPHSRTKPLIWSHVSLFVSILSLLSHVSLLCLSSSALSVLGFLSDHLVPLFPNNKIRSFWQQTRGNFLRKICQSLWVSTELQFPSPSPCVSVQTRNTYLTHKLHTHVL